jgi:hypothetical protein
MNCQAGQGVVGLYFDDLPPFTAFPGGDLLGMHSAQFVLPHRAAASVD